MAREPVLLAEGDGGLLTLTLNRPEALNALGRGMGASLNSELARAARDPRVRAVLVTGNGRAFCSGGDMKSRGKPDASELLAAELGEDPVWNSTEMRVARMNEGAATFLHLRAMAKPTVAAINGLAIGAGNALALACDIRLMSDQAWLNFAYAGQALSGTSGLAWYLTNVVGTAKARDLMFFPRRIDAEEALALGLVHRVVPHEKLREEATALARQLAEGPTLAYGHIKENLNAALVQDAAAVNDLESRNYVRCTQTEDYAEAMDAFRNKRDPVFKGR